MQGFVTCHLGLHLRRQDIRLLEVCQLLASALVDGRPDFSFVCVSPAHGDGAFGQFRLQRLEAVQIFWLGGFRAAAAYG